MEYDDGKMSDEAALDESQGDSSELDDFEEEGELEMSESDTESQTSPAKGVSNDDYQFVKDEGDDVKGDVKEKKGKKLGEEVTDQ